MNGREILKATARVGATVLVLPALASFYLRSRMLGANKALEGSTQALALLPGVFGQYLRRAFLACVLEHCATTATVEFGTIFSQTGTRIEENAYVGPRCHIGLANIEHDVLIAAGVHIPSGARTHGIDAASVPIRDQEHTRTTVRIGAGTWIGSGAVVMADVGCNSVIGAGAVVTYALPANVIAAGVPARVMRQRDSGL
jgi:virginiamycin A acetyltransferase